ncbi:metalloreductase STEAP4-like [Oratosquilla oratoria]|uniref:metalloreductase STEAP4-like n=1 Tax=Oratosquilla oratoria TaxID=337810 RepID=UPI003F7742D6
MDTGDLMWDGDGRNIDLVPLQKTQLENDWDQESKSSTSNGSDKALLRTGRTKRIITPLSSENVQVVVLGSGDFGRALALRLVQAGHKGVVASRNPDRNRKLVEGFGGLIGSYEEVLPKSRIVLVAIPHWCHHNLPTELLRDKIIVDVSNRSPEEKARPKSNAERLQELLPESRVVKAFNTLSAYALENNAIQASKEVPICGDNPEARTAVAQLVRDLTFQPVDRGGLAGASQLEDQPLRFFSEEWRFAFKLSAGLFIFIWVYFLFRIQLCRGMETGVWDLGRFKMVPLTNLQLTFAIVAIWELALCYLPGVFAAYLQLWRGTKYSRFPNWLDRWLRSRKQIGLVMLLMGATHGCMAALEKMARAIEYEWHHEVYLAAGAILLALLIVLGVSSLPSVAAAMSWREFSFVQSKLGWLALIMSAIHVTFLSFPRIFHMDGFRCYVLPRGMQLSITLPYLTLLLKLPLLLPCINSRLTRIRRGHERGAPYPTIGV